MRILSTPIPLAQEKIPVMLAAGFFDGVHIGHRSVLDATIQAARRNNAQAWALTFDPHPMVVLRPEMRPPLLTQTAFRLERLAGAGLDGCLLMPFTPEFAKLTPRIFVTRTLMRGDWHPLCLFAGENWRFGARGAGKLTDLPSLSGGAINAEVVPPKLVDGEIVSSSRVRRSIQEGDIETATRLLGRPYRIRSRVIRGHGMGRELGAATANLKPLAEVLPPLGIYAIWAGIGGKTLPAVASFGTRPTFDNSPSPTPILEVHILDFAQNIYGQELDVAFVKFLRKEERYDTAEELTTQIGKDVKNTREILRDPPGDIFPPPVSLTA